MKKLVPTILVVDDQKDIVETVSFCLAQDGFAVTEAFDGHEALVKARNDEPDLIVLDVMLPKENGYQVARYLRDDFSEGKLSKRPKILLLTARTVSDKQREDFLQTWSGADAFLYKPFDLDDLLKVARKLLAEGDPKKEVSLPNPPLGGENEDNLPH